MKQPTCGHSACRQNWIDTGERQCVEPETIGTRIALRRHALGMSQAQLAQRAGCHSQSVCRIERGHMDPSASVLRALCVALQIGADHVLGLKTVPVRDGER